MNSAFGAKPRDKSSEAFAEGCLVFDESAALHGVLADMRRL